MASNGDFSSQNKSRKTIAGKLAEAFVNKTKTVKKPKSNYPAPARQSVRLQKKTVSAPSLNNIDEESNNSAILTSENEDETLNKTAISIHASLPNLTQAKKETPNQIIATEARQLFHEISKRKSLEAENTNNNENQNRVDYASLKTPTAESNKGAIRKTDFYKTSIPNDRRDTLGDLVAPQTSFDGSLNWDNEGIEFEDFEYGATSLAFQNYNEETPAAPVNTPKSVDFPIENILANEEKTRKSRLDFIKTDPFRTRFSLNPPKLTRNIQKVAEEKPETPKHTNFQELCNQRNQTKFKSVFAKEVQQQALPNYIRDNLDNDVVRRVRFSSDSQNIEEAFKLKPKRKSIVTQTERFSSESGTEFETCRNQALFQIPSESQREKKLKKKTLERKSSIVPSLFFRLS